MKILYISKLDWYWTKQRPQHLAKSMSIQNKVDFLSIRPWKDKNKLFEKNRSEFNVDKLKVYRKRVSPKRESQLGELLSDAILKKYVKRLYEKNNYDLIICSHPHHVKYIPDYFKGNLIYDCMDDQVEMSLNRDKAFAEEKELINRVDGVVASSSYLQKELINRYSFIGNSIVINNAVEADRFFKYLEKNNIKSHVQKKIGYIGSIDTWMDLGSIKEASLTYANVSFEFYGPINPKMAEKLQNMPSNVSFKGEIPYEKIPAILQQFDIAIMPFINNKLVLSVNPVKIYEYLSMGKKVIANENSETKAFGDLIWTYKDTDDFISIIKNLLQLEDDESVVARRIDFVKKNNWVERTNQFLNFCKKIESEGSF